MAADGGEYFARERERVLEDIPTREELEKGLWKAYGPGRREVQNELDDNAVWGERWCGRIGVWRGDITTLRVGGIVNAANEGLLGGGGIDEAVHKGAGRVLQYECAVATTVRKSLCLPGQTVVTRAYNLPASYVLHTVAPYLDEDGNTQDDVMAACYRGILEAASEFQIDTVAIPSIGTGFYGFPMPKAASLAVNVVGEWVEADLARAQAGVGRETQWQYPRRVVFVPWTKSQEKLYLKALSRREANDPDPDPDPDSDSDPDHDHNHNNE